MFDFGAVGDSSASSTFFFDDITQTNATGTIGLEDISNKFGKKRKAAIERKYRHRAQIGLDKES